MGGGGGDFLALLIGEQSEPSLRSWMRYFVLLCMAYVQCYKSKSKKFFGVFFLHLKMIISLLTCQYNISSIYILSHMIRSQTPFQT